MEEGYGFGVVYSVGTGVGFELDFEVWLVEFVVVVVVILVDDGKFWEVVNEEEFVDVLLEDEVELEDMKLWEKKMIISIYFKNSIEIFKFSGGKFLY